MFKGIFTPVISIFDEKGDIDKNSTRVFLEKLISDKVDGILMLGSLGEFFNFSFEEKKEFIKFVSGAVAGRTKLLVGTGSNNIREAVELNKFCESLQVDAVLAVTPYYFGLNEEHLYYYYKTISQATKLPILVYNYPARTSVNVSTELLFKLTTDFRNIVGIKDTTESVANVRKYAQAIKPVRKDFSILSGLDENLIPNLLAGGDGIIGGITNFNAKLLTDTYKAFVDKDLDRIIALQDKIFKLSKIYDLTDPFILAVKEAVKMSLGIEMNTSLRNYGVKADEKTKSEIGELLKI